MFSKQPSETPNPSKTQLPKTQSSEPLISSTSNPITNVAKQQKEIIEDLNKPEIVNIVEKLSNILSPYFIVLVGLYLYNKDSLFSFLLGTTLIITGIASILKISGNDFNKFIAWFKKTLGYNNNDLTPED